MSYGWLTESALMPKKSKPIKVEDEGSIFAIKAVLQRQKQKALLNNKNQPIKSKPKSTKNTGIQERIRKDEMSNSKVSQSNRDVTLHKKQKLYKDLQSRKRNIRQLLVNFEQKGLDDDAEQYEQQREKFYTGKLNQLKNIKENEREEVQEPNARERVAWEKEALEELNGKVKEDEKVKQVFDRKMKDCEKEALSSVLKELSQEQKIMEEARKRRQQIRSQRAIKLKRLSELNTPLELKKQQKQKEFTQEKIPQSAQKPQN